MTRQRRGNDTLNGGTGSDTMAGGTGDDTYVVDDAGDVVTERAGEGTDTGAEQLSRTRSAANVENLTLTGVGQHQRHRQRLGQHDYRQHRQQLARRRRRQRHDGWRHGNDTLAGGNNDDSLTGGIGADSRTAAPATTRCSAAPATTPTWSTRRATWSPKLAGGGTDTVQSSDHLYARQRTSRT